MKKTKLVFLSSFIFLSLCFFYYPPSAAQTTSPPFSQGADIKEVPLLIRNAISAGAHFERRELLQTVASPLENHPGLSQILKHGTVLTLNESVVENTLREKVQFLTLPLPDGKGGTLELQLTKVDILAPGFSVKTAAPTTEDLAESLGVHYRGIVKGDERSLAAISVFQNEVMGFFSTETEGNSVLGRFSGNNPSNKHILYAVKDLKVTPGFSCDTQDPGVTLPAADLQEPEGQAGNCIRIYIEADHDLFLNKGSVANTVSYLTGLFNQSATLYGNDGIPVSLSEMLIWNAQSPYAGLTTPLQLRNKFQEIRNTFNGDLGHLVAIRGNGGIAAGFNGFCNANLDEHQCFSGIDPFYNNVPVYSWSVYVFTHEMGHLMGSRHTHACVWNGNSTAIDGCSGAVEGVCPLPGQPPEGGTIMSYCHQTSVGMNFSLGFGPQPRNLILNRFNAASCLTDCGGGGGQELLTNGGFEFGYTDWSFSGNGSILQGSYPHTGAWYAFLGNVDNGFAILAHNYFVIPASASSATFSFWLNIVTQETTVGPYDTLIVNLIDGGGNAHRLATYSEADAGSNSNGDYSRRSFDVSAYRGQSVQVQFVGSTDVTLPTIFRVDDVSLLAGSSGQKPDFNTDGYSDILWQNNGTGERRIWLMNGSQPPVSNFLASVGTEWQVASSGDFDRDGQVDILWQRTTDGERRIWLMNGLQPRSSNFLATLNPQWQMTGTGDFDRDGQVDILWQNTATGERRIWRMNGTLPIESVFLAWVGTEWQIAGTGDFDRDGKVDILWQRTTDGERRIWRMNGTQPLESVYVRTVGTEWQMTGTGDFDRDGQVDILWQHTGTGERRIWLMDGLQPRVSNFLATVLPTQWNIRNF